MTVAPIIGAILALEHVGPDAEPVDLGSDHAYTKEIVNGTWVGIWEWHFNLAGELCAGIAYFDIPEAAPLAEASKAPGRWTVESWAPLTLTPSLHCDPSGKKCASHGHIIAGRWT